MVELTDNKRSEIFIMQSVFRDKININSGILMNQINYVIKIPQIKKQVFIYTNKTNKTSSIDIEVFLFCEFHEKIKRRGFFFDNYLTKYFMTFFQT